jgi:TRAP transporter TAXI family solute receptor
MRRAEQFTTLGKSYRIEWVQFQGTAPMVQAMVAGSLDCSTQAPLSLANGAIQGGLQAYIIAQHVGERPGSFSVYWAVKQDSPIKTVADMKGHTIAYGFTSQEIIGKIVDAMLATAGLSIKDLKPVMVPNLVRGVDAFENGRADITVFALGSGKVSEADASVHGIRFISLANTPEALKGLKSQFRTAYIGQAKPSPHYAGVKTPINIMQFDYTIFTSTKVPADRIKKITELVATNKKALAASHPLFKSLDPNRMYTEIDVPYADGAVAYYKAKGIKEAK